MNEKKYKTITMILLIVVVMLSAYIIFDGLGLSVSINKNQSSTEEEKDTSRDEESNTSVVYDLKKAEELVAKYYLGSSGPVQGFVDLLNETEKLLLTIPNVSKTEKKCEDVYSKLINAEKTDYGYVIKSNGDMFVCEDNTNIINYLDLNSEYQSLFGSNQYIPKTNLTYGWGILYYYDEVNNRFISAEWSGGGNSATFNSYVVKSAEIINEQLIINVGYACGGADKEIELKNGTAPASEFDSLDKKEQFLSKYKERLKVKTFTFKLDNGNYVLKNIEG